MKERRRIWPGIKHFISGTAPHEFNVVTIVSHKKSFLTVKKKGANRTKPLLFPTICPRSLDSIYEETYIKKGKTSWTDSTKF